MGVISEHPVFLSGKITRTLFFAFLIFALIPISLFAYMALSRTSEATREQVQEQLEVETDNLSYLVLERLIFADRVLQLAMEQGSIDQELKGELSFPISTVEFVSYESPVWLGLLAQSMHDMLKQGKPVVVDRATGSDSGDAYLLRQTQDGGLAVNGLSGEQILGAVENRDQSRHTCVLGYRQEILFSSSRAHCQAFRAALTPALGHRGFVAYGQDTEYLAYYRELFMIERFGTGNWLVAVIRPREEMMLSNTLFQQTFTAVALAVILVLALILLYFIRVKMAPLSAVMEGIRRVSARNYLEPVVVSSGDEFEQLADAFNDMSKRVLQQLQTMASMSEIDQLILNRQTMEALISVVLEHASSVLPGHSVHMLLLDEQDEDGPPSDAAETALVRHSSTGGGQVEAFPVSLDSATVKDLAEGPVSLSRASATALFAGLPQDLQQLALIPLSKEGRLAGAFALAFTEPCALDEDVSEIARNFADRISVALANADWEEKLFRQANFDSLTGLPNRLSMMEQMHGRISQCRRLGQTFAVAFLDLDNFKLINDALGHHAGDEMITIIGERLESAMRSDDIVARIGGDEFVVISSVFPDSMVASLGMGRVAEKIHAAVGEPLEVSGREIRSSTSIGVTFYPRDGDNPDSLLKNADTAMYAAKAQGPGNVQFFSEALNEESMELMALSSDIKRALVDDEFELNYQPKVDLATGEVVGAEALIRWNHPVRGRIPPGMFIEVAERMGLISAIGDWTLHEACRQIAQWVGAGISVPRVAVNMSAIQIHEEDIPAKVSDILDKHGVKPHQLELEIVEGVLVEDLEATSTKLQQVREQGVHISIDDYGTGYSSLSYVRSFPVDTLKIDRSFITNICDKPEDSAIVNSTIVLAHNLGLSVIAEGVENKEQVAMLKSLECDQIQGYYCCYPLAADEFCRYLSEPEMRDMAVL